MTALDLVLKTVDATMKIQTINLLREATEPAEAKAFGVFRAERSRPDYSGHTPQAQESS